MDTIRLTVSQKRWLAWTTISALVVGGLFLAPYLRLVIVSAIVAYLFNPLYYRLTSKYKRPGLSALATLIVSMLIVIIPLCLIVVLTIGQTEKLLADLDSAAATKNIDTLIPNILDGLNRWLSSIGVAYQLTAGQLTEAIKQGLAAVGNAVLTLLSTSIGNIASFFTILILYIFVFTSLLQHQTTIRQAFAGLNVFGDDLGRLYAQRIGAMTKATIRGQFVIGLAQGFASSLGFYIAGVHGVFFLGLVVFTTLSIVPLGAGIVTIPAGIIMMLLGNVWAGLFLVTWHLLVVTNIDNFLRPKLVPKEARLNSALMLLAVFAGMVHFGFLGIVLGPVLMVVLVTTIQVYLAAKPQLADVDSETVKHNNKRRRIPSVRSLWRRGKHLLERKQEHRV